MYLDDLLPDDNSPADTEIVKVATLSAIYERQCEYYVLQRFLLHCVASDTILGVGRMSDSIRGRMISTLEPRYPLGPAYVVSSRALEGPHPQVYVGQTP